MISIMQAYSVFLNLPLRKMQLLYTTFVVTCSLAARGNLSWFENTMQYKTIEIFIPPGNLTGTLVTIVSKQSNTNNKQLLSMPAHAARP